MSLFGSTTGTTGGGLFGNTNTNTQAGPGQQPNAGGTGGGLFGNMGSTSTGQSSLFGNTNTAASQQPSASSSLFGNINATSASQNTPSTGSGLFGGTSTTNTQPSTGGGLFGNTPTNQQQPASGGLFGSTTTPQPASGGLFGNTTTQTQPGGGLFGNTNTNMNQQQQQPGTSGGGLFGNTNTGTQPSTGGLFGNTSTSTATQSNAGGLFGNANTMGTQPSTGGLFGTTAGTSTQPSGGLFGNTSTATQPSGSLFGNTTSTAQPGTGGLFGGTSNTTATGTGSNLFGNTNTSGSGGLFGNTASNSIGGGGLFGPSTQNTAAPTSSLFGNNQNMQQQQGGTLFGQTQSSQPQGSLFGGSTLGRSTLGQSVLGGGLLGSTLGSSSLGGGLLSSRAPIISSQPADPQSQFVALSQRLEALVASWNPNSPDCRFQHYFYNLVDPSQVHLYGRPPNATNEALWQKAVHENPDPSCLVPALAVGFDDLQKRVEAQTQTAAAHQDKIKELRTRIENLSRRHELSNSSRLHRAAVLQAQVQHRILKLVQHLHLLIPTLRSSSIRPEEEALRAALEDIDAEIRRPGGMGRLKGKLNELWALIGAVSAARERDGGRSDGGLGWAVVNEDGLNQMAQILIEQQAGLEHLTKILQRDLKDLAVIQGVSVRSEDDTEQQTDFLLSSTATLRGRTIG